MAGLDSEARRKLEARAERMEIDARRPADEVAKLRGGRGPWRRTQNTREGVTVACSFTLSEAHDRLVIDMALGENCSRSEIVRRAIVHLATCPKARN